MPLIAQIAVAGLDDLVDHLLHPGRTAPHLRDHEYVVGAGLVGRGARKYLGAADARRTGHAAILERRQHLGCRADAGDGPHDPPGGPAAAANLRLERATRGERPAVEGDARRFRQLPSHVPHEVPDGEEQERNRAGHD